MKQYTLQPGLILLALFVIGLTLYLAPLTLTTFPNASYRFVIFFLLLISASNILAKIAHKYINS